MTAVYRRSRAIRRPRTQGFTLVEVLLAVGFMILIIGSVVWMNVNMVAIAQRVAATATLQSQARLALDGMINDIHAGDQVLASYSTYTSSTTGTLILEQPAYLSSGTLIAGQYDHTIYHLVGSSAPYALNRVIFAVSGSARVSSADTVIAKNVQSLTFIGLVDQAVTGDGATTRFGMNAPITGSVATWVQSVQKNGAAVTIVTSAPSAGQVEFLSASTTPAFPQGSILFGSAPAASDGVDQQYSVDPSIAASASQITQVTVDLHVGSTDASLGPSGIESVEMVNSTNLHNH